MTRLAVEEPAVPSVRRLLMESYSEGQKGIGSRPQSVLRLEDLPFLYSFRTQQQGNDRQALNLKLGAYSPYSSINYNRMRL